MGVILQRADCISTMLKDAVMLAMQVDAWENRDVVTAAINRIYTQIWMVIHC